jgi:hypothetical protein
LTKGLGQQTLKLKASPLAALGHAFDPLSEQVAIAIADQSGPVYAATIPAGGAVWKVGAKNGVPMRYLYRDPTGGIGGITRIVLRALDASGVGTRFRVEITMKRATLSAAMDVRAATATLRIGNDCWQETTPCVRKSHGQTADCRTPDQVCAGN